MADMFAKVSAGLDRHPKIRKAGNLGRQVFEYVLRANADTGRNGWVDGIYVDPVYLAETLMVTVGDAGDGLRHAVTAGLLALEDDGSVHIVGWDEGWASGPVPGADRTRKWRDKMKKPTAVTKCDDANVTQSHRDVGDAEEKRREEKIERAASAAPPPKPSRKKPTQPLPADWQPNDQHRALAASERRDVAREAERFRDWAANAKPKADWDAAFRNWLRNEFGAGSAAPKAPRLDLGPAYDRERDFDA